MKPTTNPFLEGPFLKDVIGSGFHGGPRQIAAKLGIKGKENLDQFTRYMNTMCKSCWEQGERAGRDNKSYEIRDVLGLNSDLSSLEDSVDNCWRNRGGGDEY